MPVFARIASKTALRSNGDRFPKSSKVFAKYLGAKLTIEQIGTGDQSSESAVQYAERLLKKTDAISEDDARNIAQ